MKTGEQITGHWRLIEPNDRFITWPELGKDDHVVTIKATTWEEIPIAGTARKEVKPVIWFVEAKKGLVVNKTNRKQIQKSTGKENVEDWNGEQITIYADPSVKFAGERVGGIRVRRSATTQQ